MRTCAMPSWICIRNLCSRTFLPTSSGVTPTSPSLPYLNEAILISNWLSRAPTSSSRALDLIIKLLNLKIHHSKLAPRRERTDSFYSAKNSKNSHLVLRRNGAGMERGGPALGHARSDKEQRSGPGRAASRCPVVRFHSLVQTQVAW